MATHLNDLGHNAVMAEAVTGQTVTGTVTGAAADMIGGDGLCQCHVQVSVLTAAAGGTVNVQVQQSTASGGTFTNITGASVAVAAAGVTAFNFQRDNEYLKAVVTVTNATTAVMAASFLQPRKFIAQ